MRNKSVFAIVCGIAGAVFGSCSGSGNNAESNGVEDTLTILVGSYSEPGDTALRVYRYNPGAKNFQLESSLAVSNASYFTQAPSGMVYAVCESDDAGSSVTALSPTDSCGFKILNTLPVGSASPCYIQVSPDGRFVVTANYNGGTAAVFPIAEDGSLLPRRQLLEFEGSGPVTDRQEQSHPHCIAFTPDGKYMLVDDLGTDQIHQFTVLENNDCLVPPTATSEVAIAPGSGPRHIVFNDRGDTAYLINEIADNVTVLKYDGSVLTPVQYIAADTIGARGAGDIHLSPDGQYLYASLRLKNDGIVTFEVDSQTGLLTYKAHTPTLRHPRNFTLTPDGRQILVASRDDNAVQIFDIDGETGIPTDSGHRLEVSKPVCVKFVNP